ncbi:MAG: Tn3 family transposase [Pseudomonadota bacterium]|nr:Tn3 family transposase [Pseudomonadota bacterium]
MTTINETAYPRIKPNMSQSELQSVYTPTPEDIAYVRQQRRRKLDQLALLVHIKLTQRLGYFLKSPDIPNKIISHISEQMKMRSAPRKYLSRFDRGGSRTRLKALVRRYLDIKLIESNDKTTLLLHKLSSEASEKKHEIADIINIVIEGLVKQRYELPGFSTLVKYAKSAKKQVNDAYFKQTHRKLNHELTAELDRMLNSSGSKTHWDSIKREVKKPTNKEVKSYLQHLQWLQGLVERLPNMEFLPLTKKHHFTLEARSLDAFHLKEMKQAKRYTLMVLMIQSKLSQSLDDVAGIFKRKLNKLHQSAETRLMEYHQEHTQRTEKLISQFRNVLKTYGDNEAGVPPSLSDIRNAMSEEPAILLAECEEHLAYAGNNYYPFMLKLYKPQRAQLLNCLELLELGSSSEDSSILLALETILEYRNTHKQELGHYEEFVAQPWVNDKWKKLIFNADTKTVNRKYFELCVLSRIKNELSSGDLFIRYSLEHSDYRKELISWDEYEQGLSEYTDMLGFSKDSKTFATELKKTLSELSTQVDEQFQSNEFLDFNNDQLVIRRHQNIPEPQQLKKLDEALRDSLEEKSIVDILVESEQWLDAHKLFKPVSGFESKLDNPRKRFISTLFCYGCNLGPTQTARSIKTLSRKQVAWLNLKYVTEEKLEKAIVKTVNAYNKFELPSFWGSGKSASADGTKWNVYEQNLLSEYHIRYGGYGGIGYYHVSDTYIALFSHFIPCGVYEAIYILDGLIKNESDIQPDVIHGDTQAQSTTVFGLAHLLGIDLMPRIRNIKKLVFYKADGRTKYKHINRLFRGNINWSLIERHLPDMLRVALSIQAGKISPSTILKRLGTYSRKNRLYFAFRELGRAIRTIFLLKYISDVELRRTIHSATNKSEEFNNFTKWLFFGGDGIIAENVRHEQRKVIKYNQLVANLVILHNVQSMTEVLSQLKQRQMPISEEVLKFLSPYRTEHINRFGDYHLDLSKKRKPLNYKLDIIKSQSPQ